MSCTNAVSPHFSGRSVIVLTVMSKLPMRIGLTQSNLDREHGLLMKVAHPEPPSFSKHYTAEEVADIFAPTAKAADSVRAWLESAGIEASRITQSANKQWLQFDAKSSEAEDLLKVKYHFYEHESTEKLVLLAVTKPCAKVKFYRSAATVGQPAFTVPLLSDNVHDDLTQIVLNTSRRNHRNVLMFFNVEAEHKLKTTLEARNN